MRDPPPAGRPPGLQPGDRPGAARDSPRRRDATFPAFAQGLGFRLSSLFAVALLPLGLVSLVQADAWLTAARAREVAALMGETLRAAAPEVGLIREAQGAAAALAQTVVPLVGDEGVCDGAMTGLARNAPQYSVVAFVPVDGVMTCAANGASFDYSDTPLFRQMRADGFVPKVYVQARGPVSGVSVVLVIHPVQVEDGAMLGYVALALPHATLGGVDEAGREVTDAAPGRGSDPGMAAGPLLARPDFVTFNGDGAVLTTARGYGGDDLLPEGIALGDIAGAAESFPGRTAAGEERLYAVVPVVPGALYALGSIPARQAVDVGPVAVVAPLLVAALMWAGSLLVAWFAAERLVTRYIRRLSRAIRSFAQGSRMVGDLDMARAPAEIREAGDAFVRMTDAILHDEAEMEDVVHQKEVLLREVHHRVKNNLQLIASIMNMQMRRARSPETRALMQGLQERVMSLATVHKELYQTTGLADVRADELLSDITGQIVRMSSAPGRRFQVETDFAPIRLIPDQAVPLSLLLTEGLTNAIKYAAAAPGERLPRLDLGFAAAGPGRAELSIVNSTGRRPATPETDAADGTGLGSQLIDAFAAQLGGEVRREVAGDAYALRIAFALADLEGGEERHAPAASSPSEMA